MKTPSRLIILLAGLVLCTVCGVLYAWSIFVVPLEQAFGWQRPETSLTFTFMITFFSLGMFAGGKLLRFGPARAVQIGGALLGVGLSLLQQHFGLIEIPAETLLAKSYPVEFRPGDLLAVLAAFGLVAYVISNITVRSMVKHNA